jgi:hypothetical protein
MTEAARSLLAAKLKQRGNLTDATVAGLVDGASTQLAGLVADGQVDESGVTRLAIVLRSQARHAAVSGHLDRRHGKDRAPGVGGGTRGSDGRFAPAKGSAGRAEAVRRFGGGS